MSESSFTSDSDSESFILTPGSSDFTPEASILESSMIDVTASSPSPSLSSHDSDSDDDDEEGDAEAEWQESLQQLELLLSMVLVPFIGKWVGRKCAYIAWGKFMTWKYPVEVVVTDKVTFSIVGMVGAVSPPL